MKVSLSSTGLTSATLVTLTFLSLSEAWPHHEHQHQHHHHGPAHHVHPAPSAGSGSGLIYNSVGALSGLATGTAAVTASCGHGHGYAQNRTFRSWQPSTISKKPVNNTGTATLSSYHKPTSDTKQNLTSTRAAEVTTVHLTETSTVKVTVQRSGATSNTHSERTSSVIQGSNTANVAKRVESVSSSIGLGAYSSATAGLSSSSDGFLLATAAAIAGSSSSADPFGGSYQSFQLGPFPKPSVSSSTASASASVASSLCPSNNGTTYTSSQGQKYKLICDVDYLHNDLRFILASSFDDCVQRCDTFNTQSNGGNKCVGALFVPSRLYDKDDCYLKSSVSNPTPSEFGISAAILLPGSSSSLTSFSSISSATVSKSSSGASTTSSPAATTSGAISAVPAPTLSHASGTSVMAPTVAASYLQGPSVNKPSTQYINWKAPGNIKLATNLLNVGVNDLLSTTYPLSLDTGILELNTSTQDLLADLVDTPHISRDGGKGGYLNGQHLFVFCDTGAYTATTGYSHGDFLGFVSSSVAVDTGMNGLSRKALTLQDGIGQWSDNVGRMRGFSPLTEGEQSYNLAMQGKGMRYAIWPESSLIPLDATNAIIYAPIVYDNVNMATKAAVFTYTGATLLAVTAGGSGGPVATRTVDKLFNQDEVEWGCIGGIRSWGNSGIGGTDGKVYIFGKVQGGLLLARTRHGNVADRNSYEYWTGNGWTHEIQSASSTAYFISGNFMDVDVFYSPRHLTFVIVYMNTYADNTFYFRYLNADHAILPPSAPGGDPLSDYVENMVGHQWSKEEVLYKASPGTSGKYIYSGGVHQGYYGDNDITNGGSKMLLSWTAPTGGNPASESGEYQIVTAEIEWV